MKIKTSKIQVIDKDGTKFIKEATKKEIFVASMAGLLCMNNNMLTIDFYNTKLNEENND